MAFSLMKIIKGVLIREENTLTPKELELLPGGTAGTKTTVQASQTTNRTLTLPDATDTIVGRQTTDTLTNKSIDADSNTITNIENADIKTGAAIDAAKIHDGSVSNAEFGYLANVTSDIQTQINAKADQTALDNHINDTTDAHDASAISNVPSGNLIATDVQGALNELQTDVDTRATSAALTAHTGASSGVHGVTGSVVGTTDSQTLTNKTIDGDDNTVQDLPIGAIKTVIGNATKFFSFDGSGAPVAIKDVPTGTVVGTSDTQTLSNKTLTSPEIDTGLVDDGLDFIEEASITSPASGRRRLALKTDGKLYLRDSSGNEKVVGEGSGGINYILNPDAESDVSGWTTYADAAGTEPVDGTGGSPNVTWTRTTSSPLRGLASFLFTKDASNRQGQGVSYDFTIDPADQAKALKVSFDYNIASGTFAAGSSSALSDMTVWIYDITNARLIQPSNFKFFSNGSQSENFSTTFQTAPDSTSYRLILHVGSTSASAYTLKFDNFLAGPSEYVYGLPATDWSTLSGVSLSNAGNATISTTYRRVGDSGEFSGLITIGSTLPTGSIEVNFPGGISFDTAKVSETVCGAVSANSGGGAIHTGAVAFVSPSKISFYGDDGSGIWNASTPFTFANGNVIAFSFIAPVVGWSASTQMSDSADTRIVAMTAISQLPTGTINAGYNNVIFGSVLDTHGAYNTSTGNYTVPVSGWYKLTGVIDIAASFTANNYIGFRLGNISNGVYQYSFERIDRTTTDDYVCTGSALLFANAGESLAMQSISSGTTPTFSTGLSGSGLSIERVSGPVAIAANETIAARYTSTSGQVINDNATDIINFANKTFDTHNAVATGSGWKFTAPASGIYAVDSTLVPGGTGVGGYMQIHLYKNGSFYSQGISIVSTNAGVQGTSFSDSIQLVAGDQIDIRFFNNNSGAIRTLDTSAGVNFINIRRIGL